MILKCVIIFYLFITLYHVQCKMKKHIGSACVGQDNITGTCLELYKCPSAVIIYLYYNHGYDVPSLPEVCAYDDTEPVVCCTDCFIDEDEDKTSQFYQLDRFGALVNTQHKPEAAASCHYFLIKEPYPCLSMESFEISKYLASNKTCHLWRVESSANVSTVGDGATENTELRYLVLIGYGEDKVDPQWLCRGVVVNYNHILITAHCATHPTWGPAKNVVTGLHKPEQEWNRYDIKKIHIHPDYKPPSRYHDIALLYLDDFFDFDKDFLPACMDTTNLTHRAVQAVYWDWNRFGKNNESAYNQQMVVQFKLDDAKCKELFPPDDFLEHGYDPLTQTCYGIPDQIVDNCGGNSSGVIQTSYHDCQYTVTGLKVYSKGCGAAGGASLYTRIQHYMPWIEGIMWPSNDYDSLDSSKYDSDDESDDKTSTVSPEYDEGDESDEDK